MTSLKSAQLAEQRIENAIHELNDAIRCGGEISLNTCLVIHEVSDQRGQRDIVFAEIKINPSKLEID